MAVGVSEALELGRAAVDRYAWTEGYELLKQADSAGRIPPEDLERLASAAWWTARLDECIAARERAFAGYRDAGNENRAAMVALMLAKDYYAKGASSIGTGWVNRAERLLDDKHACVEQGHLERIKAVIAHEGAGDYEKALGHARRALEFATSFGDRDLQAIALHDQGRALAGLGQVDEGMGLMDEATVAAVSGELAPLTTGVVYCNTITACKELADYRRAGDWTEAAKRWCERQEIAGFPGMCRVYRASIMLTKGAWAEAESEARRACDELGTFNLSYAAEAFYELGEIRLRSGDLAAAEDAFRQAHELGRDPQPGLALVRLAEDKLDGASSCIEGALADESRDLYRARLLPAQARIALESRSLDKARAAAHELEEIARKYGSDALEASALAVRSLVARDEENLPEATRAARSAIRHWQAVGAPYEAAEARVVLASTHARAGHTEDAVFEFEAALSAFERLGAAADARHVRKALEDLGAAPSPSGRGGDRATKTFMFTDVVRSTKLVDAIGDDAWTDVVRWHDQTLRGLFAAHRGEEIDHTGDGFFVAFPDTRSAIECAVAVQRKLAEHRRSHGFAPQVRIGLHRTEASRHGPGYKGRGVHEAARISALAEGGEILASHETVSREPPRFVTSEPRAVALSGIDEPFEIVTIDWR
jgi:class 3 adenylate cyclase